MSAAVSIKFSPSATSSLAKRLRQEVDGDVFFDAFSRGRYSTDASIYQIEPIGVVVPRTEEAARVALQIAVEEKVPILPRGAGSSQCGQSVGRALIIDHSKHLAQIGELDAANEQITVQPGVVLDQLNAALRPHGLWFPVDVSTSAQATLGGMAGNNSCGSRSIRYGNMVHNVLGIDAWLTDGTQVHFAAPQDCSANAKCVVDRVHAVAQREASEIAQRWPKVLRRVQGYNLDMVLPGTEHNMAHLLVGSEGTLAYTERLKLKLARIPARKVLGVIHFPAFYRAMECTQHIVKLGPDAVELVDRTMIDLARGNATFRPIVDRFLVGDPEAILLVEFAGETDPSHKLSALTELMADLGLPNSVVQIADSALQREIWEVRKAGLNIMMSMKGDGKPVSFIEDCAVPLEHLAEYTRELTEIFHKHGTRGTWYAHASVGTLHVRPVLNMKGDGAQKMRAIAEEACELVKRYKGAFSGEHGDGLVRSEWIEPIVGQRLTAALGEIKAIFDPHNLMNPGKIVKPTKMDDRSLFRAGPAYKPQALQTALDWSAWDVHGRGEGFLAATEMCNNNGHCRKFDAGTMCPSFRATQEEQHLTRGRANSLRLALSGQLGAGALASPAMHEAMSLCVGCKGCKRECPTGVDMARMKIEFMHHYTQRHGLSARQKMIAYLPRNAPAWSKFRSILNLRDRIPGAAALSESLTGISARRSLPLWHANSEAQWQVPAEGNREVVLFADTFNRWFEPENVSAALNVLGAAGYRVHLARGTDRPLCCGRTFLAAGLVDEAREEARRLLVALRPYAQRGVPIVGLEPSCLLTLRDEYTVMLDKTELGNVPEHALLFEEFLAREHGAGNLNLPLQAMQGKTALVHGHCHQKAFGLMGSVERVLKMIPGLKVEQIPSSCCGMAGDFGYHAEHFDVSMKMAEVSLLPKVRRAAAQDWIVAGGTSCRHQIKDGAQREAVHVAKILNAALAVR
ncbi:MAG: FAD-binding and (Fe-S)-binding domain-containing protein [Burkholderiales bacterium]